MYVGRNAGGRGLLNIYEVYERTVAKLVAYIFNTESEHGRLVKEMWMHKQDGTLLKIAEDIVDKLQVQIEFTREGVKENGSMIHSRRVGWC